MTPTRKIQPGTSLSLQTSFRLCESQNKEKRRSALKRNASIHYQKGIRGHLWSVSTYSCLLFTSVQIISLSISITVMPSNLQILSHLNISVTHGLKALTHTLGHKVGCVYDPPEADLRQKQPPMGSHAIFPQCTDPCHIRSDGSFSEVKRCSAADCH